MKLVYLSDREYAIFLFFVSYTDNTSAKRIIRSKDAYFNKSKEKQRENNKNNNNSDNKKNPKDKGK